MITYLFICLAALAVLIYFLYREDGHKPWLQDCLSSLFFAWLLINLAPIGAYLLKDELKSVATSHSAPDHENPQTSGAKQFIASHFDPYAVKGEDIDASPTCGVGSGSSC